MIRFRRYRVFLLVALVSIAAVYYYSQVAPWDPADLSGFAIPQLQKTKAENQPPVVGSGGENDQSLVDADASKTSKKGSGQQAAPALPQIISDYGIDIIEHWQKPSQFYPVPSGSTIQLPSGPPTPIPRIQHEFGQAGNREDSEKLEAVRKAMERTWNGYRTYAWMHDELKPVVNESKDPFMGWAATLVDSLDTLYIMGMKKEFAQAVKATGNIDFTTSNQTSIPVFETTIRYLGGLIGAYDISEARYPILLEKATELAEVLIGTFDTPNRLPVLYYHWKAAYTSTKHRASGASVLAELGSLSLEFTRLAQLLKEPKYYDAIARITNALDLFQSNTSLPGLWPKYVDASGCPPTRRYSTSSSRHIPNGVLLGRPSRISIRPKLEQQAPDLGNSENVSKDRYLGKDKSTFGEGNLQPDLGNGANHEEEYLQKDESSFGDDIKPLSRRQAAAEPEGEGLEVLEGLESLENCGLRQGSSTTYTLGAMADSTYEYLPKMHLLLGGRSQQYQRMYEYAMRTIDEYLLYRPMVKDGRDILFAGSFTTTAYNRQKDPETGKIAGTRDPSTGHLTCFVGGMIGLAAKIFNRKEDLEKAKKLADGCVWAYESTGSGIMPEEITPLMCEVDDPCKWNETYYWDALDPNPELRMQTSQSDYGQNNFKTEELGTAFERLATRKSSSLERRAALPESKDLHERQSDQSFSSNSNPVPDIPHPIDGSLLGPHVKLNVEDNLNSHETPTKTSPVSNPVGGQTREEYVLQKIEEYGLPYGIVNVPQRYYILRPEAIESVFYMYRMTGEDVWRQRGWEMFKAIERETQTASGASAISNALVKNSSKTNSMESFWSAETLKYFYLLFSDPDVVNLDKFVLNTEAHPLLRPDATKR